MMVLDEKSRARQSSQEYPYQLFMEIYSCQEVSLKEKNVKLMVALEENLGQSPKSLGFNLYT